MLENKNENENENNLVVDNNNNEDFDGALQSLKEKVISLRKDEENIVSSRLKLREYCDGFISRFGKNKFELGKIVSWLGDSYDRDELISILGVAVEDKGFGFTSVDEALRSVKLRLDYGLQKVEYYWHQRVTDLVSVLNQYNDYIDTFDSIELEDNSNCIDCERYLISPELHNLLIDGYKTSRDRHIRKSDSGLYLVVFKLLGGNSNTLIYRYIKYNPIFKPTLFTYIMNENNSLIIEDRFGVGVDYLFILDIAFNSDVLPNLDGVFNWDKAFNSGELSNFDGAFNSGKAFNDIIKNNFNWMHNKFNVKVFTGGGIYPRNVIDLYKILLRGCPVMLDKQSMSEFIKLVVDKKFYELSLFILNLYNLYDNSKVGLDMLKEKFNESNLVNYNLLGRCVFLVEDLDSLINIMKNSYIVNQGPQAWRGQSDSLINAISVIDNDYRKSLYLHNRYHVHEENIPRNNIIGRGRFSYQNIHLNLGNVRSHSTTSLVNTNKYYKKPSLIKDTYDIYNQLSNFIKQSPINVDTKLKLENSLYEHSYIHLKEKLLKTNKPLINYNLINSKFADLLIKERGNILDYINRCRNLSFDK